MSATNTTAGRDLRSDRTASKDGTVLAYDVRGSGGTLVYVTGASCFRRFQPVVKDAKAFAAAFTTVTYDRRGRGDSGDTAPWSLDRELEDLEAVIDATGGPAWVYGHSSGAVLALHAALRLGEKVRGVVLYDASWVADEKEGREYAMLRQSVEGLLDRGRNAAAMRRFLSGIGMPRAFVALLPLMPGWRRMVALAPTLRYDMALTADPPPYDLAATAATPMHVVVGARSPASLHAVAEGLAAAVPGAAVTVLPKQDHMVAASAILPVLTDRLRHA
ncbi:MAG: alpha/beta hydrolase [Knoellia sp.]